MEVHHHSHTPRKKWKHYFWEFLMLFLAVFCGFLAEYELEHKIERDREKVLAKAFYEDLKKDTAALHLAIDFSKRKTDAADSVISILRKPQNEWNSNTFYKQLTIVATAVPFIPTLGTYEQMKASGSLRYFEQDLVNMMNSYYVQAIRTEKRDETESLANTERFIPFLIEHINMEVIQEIRFNKPLASEMYIDINNKQDLRKMINLVVSSRIIRTRSLMEYDKQLEIADRLLNMLQEEYKL